ncbi:YhbD family protein [Inconstantimicrobium mannanitabidum]|uniref:Uncharacterized protein n=1 Tax=Inconstantimicrobium mannanitabidum TaxID=1604901 RepID=A0ACB5RIH9_9CLOT|nr:YhbD family protein [Clostridium sp. TW13]GKX68900.1 hypothetical protein rsdtw13_41580 [Clostridium sp. TW13]
MEEELITKKDLLDLTGISYGQLYRWKRKALIPDEWFIKKSSFTGQETYLPKEKILNRVNKIIELKDTVSLDELADMFSINPKSKSYTWEDIIENEISSEACLKLYSKSFGEKEEFVFKDVLCIYIFNKLLKDNILSFEQIEETIESIDFYYEKTEEKDYNLVMVKEKETIFSFFVAKDSWIPLKEYKVILDINFHDLADQIKKKLRG